MFWIPYTDFLEREFVTSLRARQIYVRRMGNTNTRADKHYAYIVHDNI